MSNLKIHFPCKRSDIPLVLAVLKDRGIDVGKAAEAAEAHTGSVSGMALEIGGGSLEGCVAMTGNYAAWMRGGHGYTAMTLSGAIASIINYAERLTPDIDGYAVNLRHGEQCVELSNGASDLILGRGDFKRLGRLKGWIIDITPLQLTTLNMVRKGLIERSGVHSSTEVDDVLDTLVDAIEKSGVKELEMNLRRSRTSDMYDSFTHEGIEYGISI